MSDYSIENTVICLDCSRSMYRRDFKPSRLQVVLNALHLFLEEKQKIDINDAVAFIVYNTNPRLIFKFEDTFAEKIKKIDQEKYFLSNFSSPLPENSRLEQTLSLSIEMLSEKIRTIGGQTNRIIIVTDQFRFNLTSKLQDLLKNAEGLNISIDVCLFFLPHQPFSMKEYLSIVNLTKGELGYFYSTKALYNGIKGFASKKIPDDAAIRLLSPREKEESKYLAEVATPLRPPSSTEYQNIIKKQSDAVKCQICFAFENPINNSSFLKSGRYCPHCNTPMHLHCAGLWALKSEVAPNLFRCPYCYTLLRIPPWIINGLENKARLRAEKTHPKAIMSNNSDKNVKMVKISDPLTLEKDSICAYCFDPFTNSDKKTNILPNPGLNSSPNNDSEKNLQKTYRCSQCNAVFHITCLEAMYKVAKSCQNCGSKIV